MKSYCIYHRRDLDGIGSAAVVKSKYPDMEFIGWDYGDKVPDIRGDILFMVDISLPTMDDMIWMSKRFNEMHWIDHHKSAIEKFTERFTGMYDPPFDFHFPDVDRMAAACEITFEVIYPNHAMNPVIRLLSQYDSWDNKNKRKWDDEILPFQYGMREVCNSLDNFPMNLFVDDSYLDEFVDGVILDGQLILNYQRKQNEMACRASFEGNVKGYKAICLNAAGFNSQSFESVWDEKKYDIMVPFRTDGKKWMVSFYSTKPEIDCAKLAEQFGGGGHKGAAGCEIPITMNIVEFLKGDITKRIWE